MVANPDAFMDPEGNLTVSPQMLGFLSSGVEGLPVNVSTKRILNARHNDRAWKARLDLALDGLQNAPTEVEAGRWATRVMNILGLPSDTTEHQDIVRAMNDPEGPASAIQSVVRHADPQSTIRAITWLGENGHLTPEDDPAGFLSQLTFEWAKQGRSGGRVTFKESGAVAAALKINEWMRLPENQETLLSIWEQHGQGTDEGVPGDHRAGAVRRHPQP